MTRRNKTGGGPGTNQYKVRGHAKAPAQVPPQAFFCLLGDGTTGPDGEDIVLPVAVAPPRITYGCCEVQEPPPQGDCEWIQLPDEDDPYCLVHRKFRSRHTPSELESSLAQPAAPTEQRRGFWSRFRRPKPSPPQFLSEF